MRSWRQHSCKGRLINFKIPGSQADLAAMGFLTARRSFNIMTQQDAKMYQWQAEMQLKKKKVAFNETSCQELSVIDYT